MTRAIAYARFSTDRQDEASIVDQLRVCRDYAARHDLVVVHEFSDEGISGAALGNRPGARAALEACGAGDVLIVNDLSRLARSQDLAPLITRLRHRGARVIGVQDAFDSESRFADMQAGISGMFSAEFRRSIADRTRSALELRARDGRPTGGKAYADVEVVREIFARFAAGDSMKAIANDLNRRGIPSPGSTWKPRANARGRWLVSALHAILHNERYAGRVVWNRSQWAKDPDTGRRVRRMRPESEWVVREVEPVVDQATWFKAQGRFTKRGSSGRGGVRRYLLSGLLECALCGSKLIIVGGRGHRYTCGAFHAGGPHACQNSTTVARKVAEARILEPVLERVLSPDAIARGLQLMRAERAAAEREANPDREQLRRLEGLVREGVLEPDVAAPAIAEARRRVAQPRGLAWPSEEAWRAAVEDLRADVAGDDVHTARACLERLLGPIPCRPVEGGLVAELRARSVMLKTGTGGSDGRWVGSGGVIPTYLPSRTIARPRAS